jgi:hypothetical protein
MFHKPSIEAAFLLERRCAMDVSDVKTLLQIPAEDTSKDEYLAAALPLLVEYVKSYCNQTFLVLDEETGRRVRGITRGCKVCDCKNG